MKAILLKTNEKAKVVEIPDDHDYTEIRDLIEVSIITVAERKIFKTNTYYDLWVDDEGLIKDGDISINGLSTDGNEVLAGNILITHHDEEGNTTGLTDEEIEKIFDLKNGSLVDVEKLNKFSGQDKEHKFRLGENLYVMPHSQILRYEF